MRCSNCGEEIRQGSKFCGKCGAPAPTKKEADKRPLSYQIGRILGRVKRGNRKPLYVAAAVIVILVVAFVVVPTLTKHGIQRGVYTTSSKGSCLYFCVYTKDADGADQLKIVSRDGNGKTSDWPVESWKLNDNNEFQYNTLTFKYDDASHTITERSGTVYRFDASMTNSLM